MPEFHLWQRWGWDVLGRDALAGDRDGRATRSGNIRVCVLDQWIGGGHFQQSEMLLRCFDTGA